MIVLILKGQKPWDQFAIYDWHLKSDLSSASPGEDQEKSETMKNQGLTREICIQISNPTGK